jgi:hypothetical protein
MYITTFRDYNAREGATNKGPPVVVFDDVKDCTEFICSTKGKLTQWKDKVRYASGLN